MGVRAPGSAEGSPDAHHAATNTVTTTIASPSPISLILVTTPAPRVTGVSPGSGPPSGGTSVTITGTDLNGATAVTFGANPATGVSCTATSCTVTTPAGTGGTSVDVQVTTPGGTSSRNPVARYTYVAQADLTVTVTDSVDPAGQGIPYSYTATVTNHGPSPATSTSTTVTLTGAARTTTAASSSQGACTVADPAVTCSLGALASGASATISVTVRPDAVGTITATAVVSAAEADPNPGDNTAAQTTTIQAADISVGVGAQPHLGILVPYITYTVTAHNNGPSSVATATLTTALPPGAVATNLPAGCTTATGSVTCAYANIVSGATVTRSFHVPVGLLAIGTATATTTRTASAPADPNPTNDADSATCTVLSIILVTCR